MHCLSGLSARIPQCKATEKEAKTGFKYHLGLGSFTVAFWLTVRTILSEKIKCCDNCTNFHPLFLRAMECLLHKEYRVDFKCTLACTKRQKVLMRFRKLIIQEDFKISMGLRLDVPCQGSGSTNDGNTAWRFFKDPALTSRLLGLNETLVSQFSIIYRTINSGFFIDVPKFRAYCEQTFATYVQHYKWFTMPPSIHKMLFHGGDIIAQCQRKKIPISAYSEEVQETRNKDLKFFRDLRARKFERYFPFYRCG